MVFLLQQIQSLPLWCSPQPNRAQASSALTLQWVKSSGNHAQIVWSPPQVHWQGKMPLQGRAFTYQPRKSSTDLSTLDLHNPSSRPFSVEPVLGFFISFIVFPSSVPLTDSWAFVLTTSEYTMYLSFFIIITHRLDVCIYIKLTQYCTFPHVSCCSFLYYRVVLRNSIFYFFTYTFPFPNILFSASYQWLVTNTVHDLYTK